MTKQAFAAKMNFYDQKYGAFAALFCKTPPEEYDNVIEYLNMLQTLETDFPGILSEPLEEDQETAPDNVSPGIELLEKMDNYKEFVKAYMDIPVRQRSEALQMLLQVDTILTDREIE